jgi:hypothetical protein
MSRPLAPRVTLADQPGGTAAPVGVVGKGGLIHDGILNFRLASEFFLANLTLSRAASSTTVQMDPLLTIPIRILGEPQAAAPAPQSCLRFSWLTALIQTNTDNSSERPYAASGRAHFLRTR